MYNYPFTERLFVDYLAMNTSFLFINFKHISEKNEKTPNGKVLISIYCHNREWEIFIHKYIIHSYIINNTTALNFDHQLVK